MTDSDVLQNTGKVSHAPVEQKAKEEYQKYKQLQGMELTPVEEAFVASIDAAKVDELSEDVKKWPNLFVLCGICMSHGVAKYLHL